MFSQYYQFIVKTLFGSMTEKALPGYVTLIDRLSLLHEHLYLATNKHAYYDSYMGQFSDIVVIEFVLAKQ